MDIAKYGSACAAGLRSWRIRTLPRTARAGNWLPIRRALASALLAIGLVQPSMASAQALDPGNFKQFVDANRLDIEIAHVLNILDHYPDGSWAKQTASFAHHELLQGNLMAMVKASNSAKVLPLIPLADLPAETPRLVLNAGLRNQSLDAVTVPNIGRPNVLQGYVLIKDSVATLGTPPGNARKRFAGILAHELTHFRNRVFFDRTLPTLTRDLVNYVNPGDPDALANAAEFMQELIANHVEWRVYKDIEHKWEGRPIPAWPRERAFYSFALILGTKLVPDRNGYLTRLSITDPAAYNRQVGLWIRFAGQNGLFHDDASINTAVSQQFQDEFSLVQPGFATPTESPDGGDLEWEVF